MAQEGDDDAQLQAALELSMQAEKGETKQPAQDISNIPQPANNTTQNTTTTEHTNQTPQNIPPPAANETNTTPTTNTTTQPTNTPPAQQSSTSTSTNTSNTVNETYLATLTAMGFPQQESRQALQATNNRIEAATNWLLSKSLAAALWAPPRVKMVLVVRTDLKMGVGKIAAQCGHASVGIYKDLSHSKQSKDRELLQQWENCASPKIALKVDGYEDMMKLEAKANALNLPTHVVLDAGKTQVAPGSATVLSIMGPVELVDKVTGELKLL